MAEDTQTITNHGDTPRPVWLEPDGAEFTLAPGESLTFTGQSEQEGGFEVVDYGDRVGVYCWPGATTTVYQAGEVIDQHPPFFDEGLPGGGSIREFIEFMFGGPGGPPPPPPKPWWRFW